MRVLILGVTGMLGSSIFRALSKPDLDTKTTPIQFDVFGLCRNFSPSPVFQKMLSTHPEKIKSGVDVLVESQLERAILDIKPDVVMNCVGVIKQKKDALDAVQTIAINALLPHRLNKMALLMGFRLVHFSTDCVFSGKKGHYSELDVSDAEDLYGRSKFLGEVYDSKSAITLRTSIIGHELSTTFSLVNWFLAQSGRVDGYSKAIYSGLPTVEMAHVLRNVVLPNPDLNGLYHLATMPITKFDLLNLIKKTYKKNIEIQENAAVAIDRSMDGRRFNQITGYKPPAWPELIQKMYVDAIQEGLYV